MLYVDRGLCYVGEMRCLSEPRWRLQRATVTERKTGRMLQPHYIQGTSVLAAFVQGDSGEQGEPDRNNTINQTRLSLKSLFLWGRKFASRGQRLTSWRLIKREWVTPV